MLPSLRSALLVIAALSGSSVAPAQVGPMAEPMIPVNGAILPQVVVPQTLTIDPVDPQSLQSDELAPAPEAVPEPATGPEASQE